MRLKNIQKVSDASPEKFGVGQPDDEAESAYYAKTESKIRNQSLEAKSTLSQKSLRQNQQITFSAGKEAGNQLKLLKLKHASIAAIHKRLPDFQPVLTGPMIERLY